MRSKKITICSLNKKKKKTYRKTSYELKPKKMRVACINIIYNYNLQHCIFTLTKVRLTVTVLLLKKKSTHLKKITIIAISLKHKPLFRNNNDNRQ